MRRMSLYMTAMPGTEARLRGESSSMLYAAFHSVGTCVTMIVSSTSEITPTFASLGIVNSSTSTGPRLGTLQLKRCTPGCRRCSASRSR